MRATSQQLRATSNAAGADLCGARQFRQLVAEFADQAIADFIALHDCRDGEPIRNFRGHILHAVDCEIDAFFEQRFFEFLDEDAFRAHLTDRGFLIAIAGSFDDDNLSLNFSRRFEKPFYVVRLTESESAAPGADACGGHESSPSRPKRSRRASIPARRRRNSRVRRSFSFGVCTTRSISSSVRRTIRSRSSDVRLAISAARSSRSLPRSLSRRSRKRCVSEIASTLVRQVSNFPMCSVIRASPRGILASRSLRFCSTISPRSSML